MTWLKDGQPLAASNRYNTHYDINTGVARLSIKDTIMNDAGVYTVVAENKAGSDRTNGRLEIEKESVIDNTPIVNPNAFASLQQPTPLSPGIPSTPLGRKDSGSGEEPIRPARVVVPLQNAQTMEGKPIRLACRVDGYPKPSVYILS